MLLSAAKYQGYSFYRFDLLRENQLVGGGNLPTQIKSSCYYRVSVKSIVKRYFQAKLSTSVHACSNPNNANMTIWKLLGFGSQCSPVKQNIPNNIF